MNKSAIRELTFKLLYSLDVQKSYEDEDIELYLEDTEVNSEQVINQVKEDIKNIIEIEFWYFEINFLLSVIILLFDKVK